MNTPRPQGQKSLIPTPSMPTVGTLAFLAFLTLGAYLRFRGLGSESFWMDEGYTMAYTEMPFFKMLSYIATRDVHPPLYYVFMKVWRQFGDTEVFLRLPSLLCGLGVVGVVWRILKEHWGILAAAAGALLVATSESFIWYSQEVRMYSLVLLLTAVSTLYMLRFVMPDAKPTRSDARGLAISTLLLLYSHNVVVFYWTGQLVVGFAMVLVAAVDKRLGERHRLWWTAQAATLVLYLLWIVVFLGQSANVENRFWVGLPDLGAIHSVFSVALAWRSWMVPQAGQIVVVAVVLAAFKALTSPRDGKGLALLSMAFFPVAAVLVYSIVRTPIMVDRTLIFIGIPLILIIASFLSTNTRYERVGWRIAAGVRGAVGVVAVACLVWLNLKAWSVEVKTPTKENFRGAVAGVTSYIRPGTAFVFNNAASQAAFDFYFQKRPGHEKVLEFGVPCHYLEVPKGEANLEPLVTQRSIDELHNKIEGMDRVVLVRSHHHYSDPSQLLLEYFNANWRFLQNLSTNGVEVYVYASGW